jgi:hypothetical protein
MKNTISILSVVVIFASATILMSSCQKEHISGDDFQNISTIENAEVNTVYSVEGVREIKIALAMNEEFDAVDIILGYNSFCDPDGGWYVVQHDTITIKVDPNWTVCKIVPRYGSPQVKISAK